MSEKLYFDPDLQPESTLKKFSEFIETFRLQYETQYPDPPKVLMDAAIKKWKFCNPEKKVDLDAYDEIRPSCISHDMVTKVIGMFSSPRMYDDWQADLPNERNRQKSTWEEFVKVMQQYYQPTENLTQSRIQL